MAQWAGAGAGAAQGLEAVLERRLKEAIRQQQERQHAEQVAIQREQMAAAAADRTANLKFREGQQARQDTEDILRDAAPGPISEQTAGVLSKTPLGQSRLTQRKVIEGVRPIAGSFGTMDESGPQSFNVLEPSEAQAKGKYKQIRLEELTKVLSGATNEKQRRAVGAEALGAEIDIPNHLLGQTGEEKTAQELASDARTNAEWERRNRITNAQADARQNRSDELMRGRASDARDDRPPTSAQSTLASYASRIEQAEPTLQSLEPQIVGMNPVVFKAQLWADNPSLQSKEIQQYMQASRNLINAVLRRESGAVISPSEFSEARQQYLPSPGDSAEVLQQKRANRALNAATYKRGAGKAYQSLDDALGQLDKGTTVNTPSGGSADRVDALIQQYSKPKPK